MEFVTTGYGEVDQTSCLALSSFSILEAFDCPIHLKFIFLLGRMEIFINEFRSESRYEMSS